MTMKKKDPYYWQREGPKNKKNKKTKSKNKKIKIKIKRPPKMIYPE